MHERKVVVFLGPSLDIATAKNIIDAEFKQPAERGDIFRVVQEGAEIIGLIDGVFFQACAVSHREILYALEEGVKVIGASSMGALRAFELELYGMIGVGVIYDGYKKGMLVSDDEVALIFEPGTFKPLSEPLVNIRYNLARAEEKQIINAEENSRLLNIGKSLYYPDRNYELIFSSAESGGEVGKEVLERLNRFLKDERRDLKREDAIEALKRLKEMAIMK